MKSKLIDLTILILLIVWSILYLLLIYPLEITSLLNENLNYEIYNWLFENANIINNVFLLTTGILLIALYIIGYYDGKNNSNIKNQKQ